MKRLLLLALALSPVLIAAQTCPSPWNSIDSNGNTVNVASAVGITSCFYASKSSGSDSNTGADEAHPWAHVPGMNGCSGNCASHSVTAGDGYVMKGGDTWSGSDIGTALNTYGSSSHWIYYGVDPAWYAGGSWSRPIWNMSSAGAGYGFLFNAGSSPAYIWIDNIEVTGMNNGQNGVYAQGAGQLRASQLYFHGWTHVAIGSNNVGFFSQGGTGAVADHNVIDGSDSSKNTMNGFYSGWDIAKYNYISYLVSGMIASGSEVHDNWLQNAVVSADGDHCNGFFNFGPSGGVILEYNNVVRMGSACSGGVQMWMDGNGSAVSTNKGFAFNNIETDTTGGNLINIGNHGSGNYGSYYVFNNQVDCTNGGCGGTLPSGPYFSIYDDNNIAFGGGYFPLFPPGGTLLGPCNNGSGTGCKDLNPSVATANSQGYSNSQIPPFNPTSGTGLSIGTGNNLTSPVCSLLPSINTDAYNACLKGSTGAVAYNATNHTVTGGSNYTPSSRPSSGAWDTGAYQFSGTPTAASPTASPAPGVYYPSVSVTLSSTTPSNTITYCVDTTNTCTPNLTYSSPFTISTTNSYIRAFANASGYLQSSTSSAGPYFIGSITNVAHQIFPSGAPTIVCSPVCPAQSIATTAAGNLLTLSVHASGTASAAAYIGSVSCTPSVGTWILPAQTQQWNANSLGVSAAYVLSTSAAVNPSCAVTMTASSPTTAMSFRQYHSQLPGGFSVDSIPSSITTASCTSCAAPNATLTGSNDVLISFGSPQGSFLSMALPYGNVDIDTATLTIAGDNENTVIGTGGVATQNNSHPSTMGTMAFTDTPGTPTFTLTITPPSNGVVVQDGTLICANGTYPSGSILGCLASGNSYYQFDHWSAAPAACLPAVNPCDSTLTANTTFTAVFVPIPVTLTVSVGSGGSVSGLTSGVYNAGQYIGPGTLIPNPGYVAGGWSGFGCSGTGTCSVFVGGLGCATACTVTASFTPTILPPSSITGVILKGVTKQ